MNCQVKRRLNSVAHIAFGSTCDRIQTESHIVKTLAARFFVSDFLCEAHGYLVLLR